MTAFWKAFLDDARRVRNACLAALGIGAALGPLNKRLDKEAAAVGRPFQPIGTGVHFGVCGVGNMGSDLRFDYSVLGDTANIASRLKGQTRYYKVANPIFSGHCNCMRNSGWKRLPLRCVGNSAERSWPWLEASP